MGGNKQTNKKHYQKTPISSFIDCLYDLMGCSQILFEWLLTVQPLWATCSLASLSSCWWSFSFYPAWTLLVSSYACLSHPQPCTTVKSLLNTVPADTREAALGSPGVSSSPDLFSPDPSASPESQCSSPWWSRWPFTELTLFCLCLSCIWRTKARYRCADNHFILTADGHINCHIAIPFPDYISLILNIKKILVLSV